MKALANETRIALPVVMVDVSESSVASWEGWSALGTLPEPADSPIPQEAQGEYAPVPVEIPIPQPTDLDQMRRVELMAPAGGPEAAHAAFHFGADAIYLGLKKFSARAEAENFTIDELDEITAYAHSLQPRRRVFVTINTLIRQDELPELVEALAHLADIAVDAVILQDLGVYHLARRFFPELELHASTQLAVHNRAGAEVLGKMGFSRVVLARELTFEEVRDITGTAGIETEVFIHGALCYSYSGLCLFSSQSLGRSGNRGKCAYSCRDDFQVTGAPLELRDGSSTKRDPRHGFPFSMKDLALPDHIPALRAAGVSCFKVEGRKKSPLYVASTTDYYRRLMDGKLAPGERPTVEADLQTVFSRPWTRLFLDSHKDKEVADRDTVGHRGSRIGQVEGVVRVGPGDYRLRFKTARSLERHDGLQIDLPTQGRPFGFAIEHLWLDQGGKRREVFEVPALSEVEVTLPDEHPTIPAGAPVYCSSSQAVKQHYRFEQPKPGQFRTRKSFSVEVNLTPEELSVTGRVGEITITQRLPGPFTPAREPPAMEKALTGALARLGSTKLILEEPTIHNDAGLFVPVSRLNQLRRDLVAELEKALEARLKNRVTEIQHAIKIGPACRAGPVGPRSRSASGTYFRWSLKVDRLEFLDSLADDDLADVDEIIIDIARDHPALLMDKVRQWGDRIRPERIRLALPALTRSWEDKGIRHKIEHLRAAGWRKWEVANLSGWNYLGIEPSQPGAYAPGSPSVDLATDWSVYVLNRLAARQLLDMGVSRFTLSPEDGLANWGSLLKEFGPRATLIVYQDTPLFIAESCAYANLIGGCPGKANCKFESMDMTSSHGEKVTALDYHCRTIVLNQSPFCLSDRLDELTKAGAISLRADLIYRRYHPNQVRDLWRNIRAGKPVPGAQAANCERGIL
jgi:putative protease